MLVFWKRQNWCAWPDYAEKKERISDRVTFRKSIKKELVHTPLRWCGRCTVRVDRSSVHGHEFIGMSVRAYLYGVEE